MTVSKGHHPYNGTVFNLTGAVRLNQTTINTDITIVWVWSTGGRILHSQRTTSIFQVTFTFEPLTTVDSGRYYLNLLLIPDENSEYVRINRDSGTFHDIVVEGML